MVEKVLKNDTLFCVTETRSRCTPCENYDCRHNLKSSKYYSCALIAADDGPLTLQEIGEFYGISRMRVCQIEKTILKKLKNQKGLLSEFDPSS